MLNITGDMQTAASQRAYKRSGKAHHATAFLAIPIDCTPSLTGDRCAHNNTSVPNSGLLRREGYGYWPSGDATTGEGGERQQTPLHAGDMKSHG